MADCPECGAKVDPAQSACTECGAKLDATASFSPVELPRTGPEPSVPVAVTGAREPMLVVQKGHGAGERFMLDRDRVSVGRDPECDIFLNDVTVSRDHAVIEVSDGDVVVRDSGSLNGTYVNDALVESAVLEDGDVVQIGTFCMAFVGKKGSGQL